MKKRGPFIYRRWLVVPRDGEFYLYSPTWKCISLTARSFEEARAYIDEQEG